MSASATQGGHNNRLRSAVAQGPSEVSLYWYWVDTNGYNLHHQQVIGPSYTIQASAGSCQYVHFSR